MTKLILLDNYNNYYNRISRKSSTIEDYIANRNYRETGFVNFNPADGVSTSHIINWPESWNPDYCLVVDEADNIISRWFIIESTRTRGGQYELTLKRDSIADNFDVVKSAPAYLLKGYVGIDNPLIFNSEGQQFNQIKTGEYAIKDDTGCAWIVGYLADAGDQKISTLSKTIKVSYNPLTTSSPDMEVDSLSRWTYSSYVDTNTPYHFTKRELEVGVRALVASDDPKFLNFYPKANILPENKVYAFSDTSDHQYTLMRTYSLNNSVPANKYNVFKNKLTLSFYSGVKYSTMQTIMRKVFISQVDERVGDQIWALDGKTLKVRATNTVYRCHVSMVDQIGTTSQQLADADAKDLLTKEFNTVLNFDGVQYSMTGNNPDIWITATWNYIRLTLEAISEAEYKINFSDESKKPYPLDDAPYYMFAIPFGETPINLGVDGYTTMSRSLALNLASKLSLELGSFLYDLQLLPYCPVKDSMKNGYITPIYRGDNVDVTQNGKPIGIVMWGSKSQFSFTKKIELNETKKVMNPIEYKTSSETELYRLCAPNYSGSFDWNPYKNDTKFPETREISLTVDCTYRPYTPYIHISPLKGYMYGGEFGDSRGLICGGDYSLTQLNSAWTTYQINNKNYQNIFDRQVSHLDFYQNIDRVQSILNIGAGRFQGAAMGASMGAQAGGPIGMAVGAGVGATAGTFSGVADAIVSELERKEEKDYMVSMYNFQLGNVQAMPYSLTKVSALSNNYKFWPFIETYKASPQEIDSMSKKLSYEGMLLSVISDIYTSVKATPVSSAPGKYVKGNFITLEQLADDTHMALDLNNELSKGLYITEEV